MAVRRFPALRDSAERGTAELPTPPRTAWRSGDGKAEDRTLLPDDQDQKAFGFPPLREAFVRSAGEARETARGLGLAFRAYPPDPEEVANCEANPLKILFISCDGWVSPCTYMGLAGRTGIPRRFDGQSLIVPRLRFGNVLEQDLLDIWDSPAYRGFREQFAKRRLGAGLRALAMMTGPKDSGLLRSGNAPEDLPPAPEPCRTCYKLHGL